MKNVAILGARGFVGKSLNKYLDGRYNVLPITRADFNLLDSDAVKSFLQKKKIDVVINCANQGGSRKTGYDSEKSDVIGNNLKMFFNIEKCLTKDMKLINFGSGAQYNKARDLIKVKEEKLSFPNIIRTKNEKIVTKPRPPIWISTPKTILPNKERVAPQLMVDKPVTHTAEIEVNKASI